MNLKRNSLPKHLKKTYSVNFYDETIELVDKARGSISRSSFLDNFVYQHLKQELDN
ncbi:hypothetical protein [Methanococcoides sp. AM1]|uniref:hypothetical protein n=1 Tax=Methanococcoides sp. AM1 TaxID=1201011 RepID=UPI0014385053|nr:hypothetical protein [Methanococcoides sp. AM1]